MSVTRTIRSAVMRRMADPARRDRRRARAEAARVQERRPHEVWYFHQPGDPYSHLAAQALRPFLERYDVQLRARVVAQPAPIAIHDPRLWDAWAQRDAALIAPHHGLQAPDARRQPGASATDLARRILLNVEGAPAFPEIAVAVDAVLQRGDAAALDALATAHGTVTPAAATRRLDQNFRLRHGLGHYLGAMFHYEGEWYWGIDRLHYLEARLDALGARRPGAPAGPSVAPPAAAQPPAAPRGRVTLEYFPSVRSPYTHLSYGRVAELCARYPVDLVVRPVLPMMMRGVKADRRKGQYILFDTQREAQRLGIAFGNIWDPFGDPVKRAYSLFPWAREQGRGFEYLREYSRAVWSERVNAQKEDGLRLVVERAGLDWAEARAHLDDPAWEAEMEGNVQAMIAAGSWGVPTLRLPPAGREPEFTVWGQDRIWLVEHEIARRLAAASQE